MSADWLTLHRGDAPLLISVPHAGVDIPEPIAARLTSPWLARKDADWYVRELYDFVADLGASFVATAMSRTVVDLNRDPSGASLYPGQTTTGLCPTETFDGELLYQTGALPDAAEIAERTALFFDPYHKALEAELARLKASFGAVTLLDAHSIRSYAPRLFEGALPHINIGTNSGRSCDQALTKRIEKVCAASVFSHVTNGRFKGGYITRAYGRPEIGVHAFQIELAVRGYLEEPDDPNETNWPSRYDAERAKLLRKTLRDIAIAAIEFASAAWRF